MQFPFEIETATNPCFVFNLYARLHHCPMCFGCSYESILGQHTFSWPNEPLFVFRMCPKIRFANAGRIVILVHEQQKSLQRHLKLKKIILCVKKWLRIVNIYSSCHIWIDLFVFWMSWKKVITSRFSIKINLRQISK